MKKVEIKVTMLDLSLFFHINANAFSLIFVCAGFDDLNLFSLSYFKAHIMKYIFMSPHLEGYETNLNYILYKIIT